MKRVPIRLRLTLAFAAAMAAVLLIVGAFVYVRVGDSLEEQLDESLALRARTLSTLVGQQDGELTAGQLGNDDENIAQVLDPDALASGALLSGSEAARGRNEPFFVRRDTLPALHGEPARLFVTPVRAVGGTLVLVVGASLEDRDEALAALLTQLLVAGALALSLATAAGYLLAGAALRPVETMRRKADEVSGESTGQRLPLPAAQDEIRRLGETLNAMLGRLEAGIERERRFVADASHELRTPLALLRTELELALSRPRSQPELEAALRSAADEADRLTRLAEDLLVLARIEEGGLALRRETLLADELLETVGRRFAGRAELARRPLVLAPASGVSFVGDRLRLEQALGNLVDNAYRHGDGTVHIGVSGRNGAVELGVSDEGTGFPPDFLDRAFDRFTRADEAREGDSTGLGLSIVDAIARAHGGTAQAVNRGANGGLVTIRIPTAAESHAAEGSPS